MGMWKRKKAGGSVFRQLIISYVIFAAILAVSLFAGTFGVLLFIGNGEISSLNPYLLVDDQGNVGDISAFEESGGWIEMLDAQYQVAGVYGEKRDTVQSYTQASLSEYLMTDNEVDTETSAKDYRGFLKAVQKQGKPVYYLMKIGREDLKLSYVYEVGTTGRHSGEAVTLGIVLASVFVLNCLLMSTYLTRKIKKPLQQITGGMEQVRAGAEGVRLDFTAEREFEEIRDSFNTMIGQLEEAAREKRVNEEKKNRMLLELSHDIKTPVSTIKSYANALEEGLVKEEQVKRYYQTVDQKANRVNSLVNEMFQLLKMEDADYVLHQERTDICEFVRQVCAEYYEVVTDAGLDFQIEIPETQIFAGIDRKETARVLENLLGNAAKYNQSGSRVKVGVAEKEPGMTEIQVRDDGEAIAEELRPVLFDPFVRGDKARQSKGGTGLGLAIAHKIMEMQDGKLEYSYEDGENVFRVCLQTGE